VILRIIDVRGTNRRAGGAKNGARARLVLSARALRAARLACKFVKLTGRATRTSTAPCFKKIETKYTLVKVVKIGV